MKTPEQKAIEMGATHFTLTPNGDSVSLYYKKEGKTWFYLSFTRRVENWVPWKWEYEWKVADGIFVSLYAQ